MSLHPKPRRIRVKNESFIKSKSSSKKMSEKRGSPRSKNKRSSIEKKSKRPDYRRLRKQKTTKEPSGISPRLIGVASLVVIALGMSFFFVQRSNKSYANDEQNRGVELWSLVPEGAIGYGQLDVGRLSKLGFFDEVIKMTKKHQNSMKKGASLEEDLKAMEVDFKKDIEDLIIVNMKVSSKTNGKPQPEGGVLIRGKFNTEAIMAFAKKQDPESVRTKINTIPVLYRDKKEDEMLAIAENQVIFLGNSEFVKKALVLFQERGSHSNISNTVSWSKAIGHRDRLFWFSSTVEPKNKKTNSKSIKIGPDFSGLRHVITSADYKNDKYIIDVNLECGSVSEAQTLRGDIQSGMMMIGGMVGMFTDGDVKVTNLVNELVMSIKTGNEGKQATLSLNIDRNMFVRLKETLNSQLKKQFIDSDSPFEATVKEKKSSSYSFPISSERSDDGTMKKGRATSKGEFGQNINNRSREKKSPQGKLSDREFIEREVEKLYTIRAAGQKLNLNKGNKVLTEDATIHEVEVKVSDFTGSTSTRKIKIVKQGDSINPIISPSTSEPCPDLLNIINKNFKLDSPESAKEMEGLLDSFYPIPSSFGKKHLKAKEIILRDREVVFVRGTFFKKLKGYIMKTDGNGFITEINYELGLEK